VSEQQPPRRLAAPISADAIGYSRLISDDEIDTVRSMTACRKRVAEVVELKGGRLVDFVGNNMLAEVAIRLYPMLPNVCNRAQGCKVRCASNHHPTGR